MEKDRKANGDVHVMLGSSLIPLINKLQEIFANFKNGSGGTTEELISNLKLPQVAVVGSQSSGKSSVLEALVGRDFLPRGCDICTRCPLVLQLQNIPADNGEALEWGEFLHSSGNRQFSDFSEIRREIKAETEKRAGFNKGVSYKEILLKIYSPKVLNMTLIDLPGITKVPVGDQPSDIEARVRKMIMLYIRQQTCIILAVSPANMDLATSDALKMAREVDPTGSRTIGVITKLDIMDKGTDASNFLLGKAIPLRLGYVGVVNRCQQDINENRSITAALAYEEQFFQNHPVYSALSNCCGISCLARRLNQILEQHVRTVLPKLKKELNSQLMVVEQEIDACQDFMEPRMDKEALLLKILTRYCEVFSAMLDGNYHEMSNKELSGGARIHHIFQSIFAESLEKLDPCEKLNDADIRIAIQNASGPRNALFVPQVPFEILVRREIGRLLDPSLQCLKEVHEELIKISRVCESAATQQFPVLKGRLENLMSKFLQDGKKCAERMIKSLIEIEMDYIKFSHPSFIGGKQALETAIQELRGSQRNLQSTSDVRLSAGDSTTWKFGISSIFSGREMVKENSTNRSYGEVGCSDQALTANSLHQSQRPCTLTSLEKERDLEVEILVIKLLLQSYYKIVKNNMLDLVPKAIMHYLVNNTKRDLLGNFMKELYRADLFDELLQENVAVVKKRKRTQEMFLVLHKALEAFAEVESQFSSRLLSVEIDNAPTFSS